MKLKLNINKYILSLVVLASFVNLNTAFADRVEDGLRVSECGELKEVLESQLGDASLSLEDQLNRAKAALAEAEAGFEACSLFCERRWSSTIEEAKANVERLNSEILTQTQSASTAVAQTGDECTDEWNKLTAVSISNYQQAGGIVNKIIETEMADESSIAQSDLAALLPEVTEQKYPTVASGNACSVGQSQEECGYVVVEILSSSEKATPDRPRDNSLSDDFLIEMAEEFNSKNKKTKSGKIIQIRVRKMASGTGFQYLSNGKYTGSENKAEGLAYSPSNSLWVKMLESQAGKIADYDVTPIAVKRKKIALKEFENDPEALANIENNMDGIVGNVAGVFIKKSTFSEKFPEGAPEDSCVIINKAINGEIKIGYTNPYVSSTGLNFLWTALSCLSPSNPTDERAAEAFREFQKNVPALFETTLSMRESVRTGGSIDAGVIEYQSFVNTRLNKDGEPEVKMSDLFEFIPFGIRHDNPMAYISNPEISAENNLLYTEGLQVFADFIASNRGAVRIAREYGFFENAAFVSNYELPEGADLVAAQKVWKDNKSGGVPVVSSFIADVSGSMGGAKMSTLRQALEVASGFIRPDMNVGLTEYAGEIKELIEIQPFTFETRRRFIQAARNLSTNGGTPMYEALMVGMNQVMTKAQEIKIQTGEDTKKMVFLLTDGEPSLIGRNQIEVDAIIFYARHFGIQIHGLGFGSGADMGAIKELGLMTDGAVLQISNVEELNEKMAKLFNSQL